MTKRSLLLVALALVLAVTTGWATGTQETAEEGETYRFLTAWGPWDLSDGRIPVEEQHEDPYFQYVEEQIGIVPEVISWEWEGSKGYVQGLRLALAGGEPIEFIRPWDEILAQELIESGRAVAMDDLLDEYGPTVKSYFAEDDLDILRANQGGSIYYLPQVASLNAARFGFIRRDWLDRVGLDVPETREELVEVYRAFKAQDANGNGDPNDEIPVSGRELLRWFDDLFVMHGVAMWEGHPQWEWNEEEGILESSQVSDSMRMALEFINALYEEGLMDPVMPVQPNADWTAKIGAERIGHYFHLIFAVPSKSAFASEYAIEDPTGLEFWAQMVQPPKAPGVPQQSNYYPTMQEPNFMITEAAESPEKIMQWLEWGTQEEQWYYKALGIPGQDWERRDGEIVILNELPSFKMLYAMGYSKDIKELLLGQPFGELQWEFIQAAEGKTVPLPNQGMPLSVYEGFEDYLPYSAPLYREFASKFITGELSIEENWDEYVEQWYDNGGQTVTDRATAWYKELHGID
jgi:putative aldouronate transport system substrate-binding protein